MTLFNLRAVRKIVPCYSGKYVHGNMLKKIVIAYAKKKLLANTRECMNFICVCMLHKLHHSIYFHPYLSLIKKLKLGTSVPNNNANTHHMLP